MNILKYAISNSPRRIKNHSDFLKSTIISSVLIILFLFNLSKSQPIYSGPAFGQISGGVQVSTTLFEGMPEKNPSGSENRIVNRSWEYMQPHVVEDIYNRTPAAAPLGSNLVYDPSVTRVITQQISCSVYVVGFQRGTGPG